MFQEEHKRKEENKIKTTNFLIFPGSDVPPFLLDSLLTLLSTVGRSAPDRNPEDLHWVLLLLSAAVIDSSEISVRLSQRFLGEEIRWDGFYLHRKGVLRALRVFPSLFRFSFFLFVFLPLLVSDPYRASFALEISLNPPEAERNSKLAKDSKVEMFFGAPLVFNYLGLFYCLSYFWLKHLRSCFFGCLLALKGLRQGMIYVWCASFWQIQVSKKVF